MLSKILHNKTLLLVLVFMAAGIDVMAQPKPDTMGNPLAQALVVIMVLLALCIALLANVVNNAAAHYREKFRNERASKAGTVSALIIGGLLLASPLGALAQSAAPPVAAAASSINGLSPFIFYLMVGVIAVEILILFALLYQLRFLIGLEKETVLKPATVSAGPKESWWWKFNKSTDISNEKDIDLSHDYDGISELDNKLPPWWIAAFGVTILFSVVYMYRYHVSHSAPLQIEELELAIKQGEAEKIAYLTKNASNVDENSVTMLDEAGIASGKTTFTQNCTPCHGAVGEGNAVGPNLTDNFWLHGGSINDIFKTIKYGVTEKGMRSWKDDLSPMQISQLTSYIHSLKGSNPPNAKEPQGEPFEEGGGAAPAKADSTGTATTKL